MLRLLIGALRKGASIPNPTPLKWAGVAVAVALLGLKAAQAAGYLLEVQDEAVIELVMVLLLLYAQIATTDKVGLLPPAADPDAGPPAYQRLRQSAKLPTKPEPSRGDS